MPQSHTSTREHEHATFTAEYKFTCTRYVTIMYINVYRVYEGTML